MSAGSQIDYEALAKKAGAISSQPAGNVDYSALAKQAGAIDSQPATPAAPETGVWAGVKRNTVGAARGLFHAFTDDASPDELQHFKDLTDQERQFQTEHGYNPNDVPDMSQNPGAASLAWYRLFEKPNDALSAKADRQVQRGEQQGGLQGASIQASGYANKALSTIPGVGPYINSIAERGEGALIPAVNEKGERIPLSQVPAERKDFSGAATDIAANQAASHAPEIIGKVAPKVAGLLKSSAQTNYEDVLNPTKQTTKYQTQKIMPQLLDERPIAMTRKGLAEKAAGKADAAGQEIEDAVTNLQGNMNTQPVIDGLQNLKKSYQVNGVSLRPEVDSAIDAVSDQMQQLGPKISLQDGVKARRILDNAVAEAKGFQGAQLSDASMAAIRKEAANSIRTELGQASPDLAAVNAKFHFWNTLNEVMEQTIQRKTGQVNALPKMETVIAGAGGLAKGGLTGAAGYGAAVNVLGKAIRSTGWRTVSAATKGAIADALVSGNFNGVMNLLGKAGVAGQVSAPRFQTNQDIYDDETLSQWKKDHDKL